MGFYAVAGWQPLSDTGAILAGGSLEFYTTGTSTPKAVYTNKALTSGSATSRTLDANGRVTANIFMLEDELYRVILKNSAGTTIWTRDEQGALALAVDEVGRRKGVARSPMDHGAVGDGATDDTTAVQAAITAATGVIDLEGLTYKITGTLTGASGKKIRNGKLLFTSAVSGNCVSLAGSVGSNQAFSANAALGATSVSLNSIGSVAALDMVILNTSSATWAGAGVSQIEYVKSVSGTTVTLSSGRGAGVGGSLLGAYNTADGAFLGRITPVSDFRMEDVTIEVQSTAGARAIDVSYCERISIRNCRFILGSTATGIRVWGSSGVQIDGCTFAPDSTSGFTSAVALRDSTREVSITNCVVRRCTSAFNLGGTQSLGGICRATTISGCSVELADSAIAMNAGSLGLDVFGCTFNGGNNSSANVDLLDIAGYDVQISDCRINDPVRHWIRIHQADNTADNSYATYVIDGCVFSGVGSASGSVILADPANATSITYGTRISITGNSFMDGTSLDDAIAIGAAGAGDFQSVIINNNDFTGVSVASGDWLMLLNARDTPRITIIGNTVGYLASCSGISIASGTPDLVLIANNMLVGGTVGLAEGISVTSASVATITNNVIFTSGDGIFLDECINFHVTGNRINATLQGIEIDNTDQEFTGGVISGNHIIAGDDAIEVDASDATGSIGLVISGNYLQSGGGAGEYVINISGIITGITITGNSCNRTNDTDDNINIAGDAAGNITQCTVSSNFLRNGAYGIDVSNNATTYHVGNSFESMATGNTNGTFAATLIST